MTRAFALALLALVVSLLSLRSSTAWAEPPNAKATPVYVLSIWTNDVDDQADALTQALRSRVRQAPGWSLADTNQSFETLSIALRCPPTPNQLCLDKIGDQLHADHYIWGTMARQRAGEVNAELRLWSRGKPQVEASETYGENLKDPNDDSLRQVAGRLLAKLTGSGSNGTLVIHAGTGAGSVVIDGATKGKLDEGVARLDVSEGAHSVTVRVPGFSTPVQSVTLQSGGEQELTFALTPTSTPAAAGTPAEIPDQHVARKPFPLRKVIGYTTFVIGLGVLVVAGAEGVAWLSDKNQSDTDRGRVPNTVTDVCNPTAPLTDDQRSAAAEACSKSNDATDKVKLGWILAGVGAVVAGTGIFLVAGDHSGDRSSEARAAAPRPKFDVLPSIGPHAGNIDLRVTF
jgi:hypothetical protein